MGTRLDNAQGLYLDGIRDGNTRRAIDRYAGDRYEQHSTGVPTGKDGFVEFFTDFLARNPNREIEIVRSFEDGRYVFLHVTQVLNGGESEWVTADIFDTDDDGRMVEHWDIIQELVDDTVSGHSMVDGPTEPTDLHLTAQNKALVRRFAEDVLCEGNLDRVADYLSTETHIQHNPGIGDGLAAFVSALEAMSARGEPMVYERIHNVIGRGDFVATLSEASLAGDAMAVIDVFRVADGRIVEHWDVMEPVPTPEQARNGGKF